MTSTLRPGLNNFNAIRPTKRMFTASSIALREWKLVETRKVAWKPEYKVGDKRPNYLPRERKEFPDYKYGESNIFKQSNKGLYGGSFIKFGNQISESKHKTRRTWHPNVIKKSLWSETLNRCIGIKMTAKVLRTIVKEGGIDNYLIKDKSARIKELGPTGWKLRYRIMQRKEQLNNPPHKDKPLVETSDGTRVKVFFEENLDGKTYRISVGRRKLMQYLYPLEKLEHKADGKGLDYKQFLDMFGHLPTNQIIERLHKLNFDLASITV